MTGGCILPEWTPFKFSPTVCTIFRMLVRVEWFCQQQRALNRHLDSKMDGCSRESLNVTYSTAQELERCSHT
jgi:hypothetical protein